MSLITKKKKKLKYSFNWWSKSANHIQLFELQEIAQVETAFFRIKIIILTFLCITSYFTKSTICHLFDSNNHPPPRGGSKKWRSQESRKKNTTKDVYSHLLLYMLVSCVWDICILSLIAWELHIFVGLICCMRDYVYIWCMR